MVIIDENRFARASAAGVIDVVIIDGVALFCPGSSNADKWAEGEPFACHERSSELDVDNIKTDFPFCSCAVCNKVLSILRKV